MSKIYIDGEYEPGRDNIRFSGFDFHNRVFPFSAVVAVLVSALVLHAILELHRTMPPPSDSQNVQSISRPRHWPTACATASWRRGSAASVAAVAAVSYAKRARQRSPMYLRLEVGNQELWSKTESGSRCDGAT